MNATKRPSKKPAKVAAAKTKAAEVIKRPAQPADQPACPCGLPWSRFLGRRVCFPCRNRSLEAEREAALKAEVEARAASRREKKKASKITSKGKAKTASKKPAAQERDGGWTMQRLILAADRAAADGDQIQLPASEAAEGSRIIKAVSRRNSGREVTPDMLRDAAVRLSEVEGISFEQVASRGLKWVADRIAP